MQVLRRTIVVLAVVVSGCSSTPSSHNTPTTPVSKAPAASTTSSTSSTTTTLPAVTHELVLHQDSPQCGKPPPPGLVVGVPLQVPGYLNRPTTIQLAADATGPMVVMFHGMQGCIENVQARTQIDDIAPSYGVSVLWLSGAPTPRRSWNVNGRCCGTAASLHVDDFAYVTAALDAARRSGAEPSALFAVGNSNGGGMAIATACHFPKLFSGAVSAAGFIGVTCPHARLSLVAFGGTLDVQLGATEATRIANHWRSSVTACPSPAVVTRNGGATTSVWQCASSTVVKLATLENVPHVWPKYEVYDIDQDIIDLATGELVSPQRK